MFVKRNRRNIYLLIGFANLFIIIILALFAPLLTKYSYSSINLYEINMKPSIMHILGTDSLGRDVWSRLLYGARISMIVGIVSTVSQIILGLILGVIAGYFGGVLDFIIMRIIDIAMCFPFFIVAIAAATIFGPSIINIIIIITLLSWVEVAKVVRAQTLSLKSRDFCIATKTLGFSPIYIIKNHIISNVLPSVVVAATISMANSILMEASLSFLGLGVRDPMPSWGNLLSSAQNVRALQSYWWEWIPAGLMIVITVLSINFIGEGFRNKYNPIKKTHKKLDIIKDIDITLTPGNILALVGESGSGKSVLANSIIDIIDKNIKATGCVMYNGKNLLSMSKKESESMRGKDIGIIFQDSMGSLNPLKKVGHQVEEVFKLHTRYDSKQRYEKTIDIFKKVNLTSPEVVYNKYPHELSGGMLQRINISIAIALNPKILIADEPTTSIDRRLKYDFINLIKEIGEKNNMSIIFITHELELIKNFADEVVVMYLGEIVEKNTKDGFFEKPLHPYSKDLIKSIPRIENKGNRFYQIKGNISNISDMNRGCVYFQRCNRCYDKCRTEKPIEKYMENKMYKCHLKNDL